MNRKQLKNLDKARKAQQDQLNENKKQKRADGDFGDVERVEVKRSLIADVPGNNVGMVGSAFRIREVTKKEVEEYLLKNKNNKFVVEL